LPIIDIHTHCAPQQAADIVTRLDLPPADTEKILWRNAAGFFGLDATA
jgi:predicted TIM-barrel fold metal-dependent hydrolase